jgi:hypothetical protein
MTSSPKVIAMFAFALTFGAGIGAARVSDAWSRGTGEAMPSSAWADAERTLGLSPAQREAIQRTFAKYQPSTDSLLTSLIPVLRAVSDSMQREIDAVLDSAQRVRLRELQRPPVYLIRRKTLEGSRVDTVTVPRGR